MTTMDIAAAAEAAAVASTLEGESSPSTTGRITAAEYKERRAERSRDHDKMQLTILDKSVAPDVKQTLRCEYSLHWRHSLFSCETCWLVPSLCVCARLALAATTRTQVIISVHPSEWGKGTNSGCLIPLTLPADGHLWLRGLPEHDRKLQAVMDDPTHTVAILFPGEQSISASELLSIANEKTGGRVAIIALDANWGGARRMRLGLPKDMLQVKLAPDNCLPEQRKVSLLRPVREYKGDIATNGRVSTLEATAALLRELGEGPVVYDALINNLKVKVGGMLQQKKHRMAFALEQEADEENASVQRRMDLAEAQAAAAAGQEE